MPAKESPPPRGRPSSRSPSLRRLSSGTISPSAPSPYAPVNPSALRESQFPPPSPDQSRQDLRSLLDGAHSDEPGLSPPNPEHGPGPASALASAVDESPVARGDIQEPDETAAEHHLRTHDAWDHGPPHAGPCHHGTLSPQPRRPRNPRSNGSIDSRLSFDPRYPPFPRPGTAGSGSSVFGVQHGDVDPARSNVMTMRANGWLPDLRDPATRKIVRRYLVYYIPFFQWSPQYRWEFFRGDLVAALTMASFYLPMSLSYAANLGHIPPINGLYSFVFNPIIYALLGSCPQLVVGPEAAGSILIGSIVRSSVDHGHSGDDDDIVNARIAGVATGMAGSMIFVAGLSRLGFLDNVLSRPFLRGFISAIGVVILVDQLIPEMGLADLAKEIGGVSHGSSLEKLAFLIEHARSSHALTLSVAFGSFAIIMVCREVKRRLQPRYPGVAYIPDRFLVVVLSAVLTAFLRWDRQGLEILGEIRSTTGHPFPIRWPFRFDHVRHIREAMGTSFLIGILGFFESSIAAKSLGDTTEGIQGMSLSANRELVALGVANMVGGCFMALPAFGGYGRSKVNASTGGRTPMSSVLLSLITVVCVLFLLPYFFFLPKAVLSSMISVVAWSLIEEAPTDLAFFWRIRGWAELGLMFLIFAATFLYSLPLGIAIGIGLSIVSVIRHSTRSRIQILGRVPGTDRFDNAEDRRESLEFIKGCLIVKMPEPLTFANTGELKSRLRRLELYGATSVHPSLPRVRDPQQNNNVIFDVHGVTGLDGSGAQVLCEIVKSYRDRGVRVFFCRVPSERSKVYRLFVRSGIVDMCGGDRYFVNSVDEALRLTEMESLTERFHDYADEE